MKLSKLAALTALALTFSATLGATTANACAKEKNGSFTSKAPSDSLRVVDDSLGGAHSKPKSTGTSSDANA